MRIAVIRMCRAGVFSLLSLASCSDTDAHEQQSTPSITKPVNDSGAMRADSGGAKATMPVSGANAQSDAMPGRDPADADSGGVPARAMDAGDRKLDAGMSDQTTPDASEAGAPMPDAGDAATSQPTTAPRLPPVSSVTMDGPFVTTVDASAGP